MKAGLMILVVVPLVLLSGCSIARTDDLGNQIGKISRIYAPGVVPSTFPDCLVETSNAYALEGRYIEIGFKQSQSVRYVNALVPSSMQLHLASMVEVRYPYCVGSHKPAIIRVIDG